MRIVPIQDRAAPSGLPALVWDNKNYRADLAIEGYEPEMLASSEEPSSLSDFIGVIQEAGDFTFGKDIETAVLICLMTDRRVETFELPEGEMNRGWPGDGFDRQGGALGSKLWLLRRRALTSGIEIEAEDYAREALQTLIDQQLVVRVDASAVANRAENRLELSVALYGRDGVSTYHRKFAVLWEAVDAA